MDIQRSILLVALAIVSYLMVLQWNEDYGQAALPTQSSAVASNSNPDLPDAPTVASSNDDIPAANSEQAQPESTVAVSDQLIRVKTDVLDLAIDPRGGDIVQLTLPAYPRRQGRPEIPFQLFDNGGERLYLAQSGLIGSNAPDKSSGRALWSSAQQQYQLADGQDELVVELKYSEAGVTYITRFSFKRGQYELVVAYRIDNQSAQAWSGNMFAQLKRDSSGDPSSTTATGTATYLGAAMWTSEEPYKKVSMSDIDKQADKETVQGGWVAWLQHYFVTAWVPAKDTSNVVQTRKDSQGNYIIGFTGPTLSVAAGAQAETSAIRALVWQHAKSWTPRQDGASLCKFQATDRAQVVIETAMDLLRTQAVLHSNRLERTFRDNRLTRIFEGTNQINRLAVIEDQQASILRRISNHLRHVATGEFS